MERPTAHDIETLKEDLKKIADSMNYSAGQAEAHVEFEVTSGLAEFKTWVKNVEKAANYLDEWLKER